MFIEDILKEMQSLEEKFISDEPLPKAPESAIQSQLSPPEDLNKAEKSEIKQTASLLAKVIASGVEQIQDLIGMLKGEDVDKMFGEKAKEKIEDMGTKLQEISSFFKKEEPKDLEEPLEKPYEEPEEEPEEETPEEEEPEEEEEESDEEETPEEQEAEGEEGEDEEEADEESEEDEEEEKKKTRLKKESINEEFCIVTADGNRVGDPTTEMVAKDLADKCSGNVEIEVYGEGYTPDRVLVKKGDEWVTK